MVLDLTPAEPAEVDPDFELIEFTILGSGLPPDDENPKGRPYIARPVTGNELSIAQGRVLAGRPGEAHESVWKFLRKLFDQDTFLDILDRIEAEEFDLEGLLEDIVPPLMEAMSTRPTQPSAASRSSRASGGRKSTAKPQPTASTRAVSRRVDSSTTSTSGRRSA